jgi:SET domain-containing protein
MKQSKDGNRQMNGTKRLNGTKRTSASKQAKPLYIVRRSSIHGRGVFAARRIAKGARVIEYKGQRVTNKEVDRRYAHVDEDDSHTFLFEVDDGWVIDAGVRGNAARWINHGCKPNCETVEEDGHIYIEATRDIARGEELTYDYKITLEERHTPRMKQIWACLCGARRCRGTMLARKR